MKAALFVQVLPVKVGTPPLPPVPVVISFITAEFARIPVNVLFIRSLVTDKETNPLGVITQEQQVTSCSSGENAYRLTQIFPTAPANPGPARAAPFAPVFVILITESPFSKFAA